MEPPTSRKIENIRENLLTCAVCMEEFTDPRSLRCHHTYCLGCIEDIVRTLPVNAKSLPCPECRRMTTIPRGGVNKLPVNFDKVKLKDEIGDEGEYRPCLVCDQSEAQFQCTDCNLNICGFCVALHRLEQHPAGRFSAEQFPAIATSSSRDNDNATRAPFCRYHPDEILRWFCLTCQEAFCISSSRFLNHSRHKVITWAQRAQQIQNEAQCELAKMAREEQSARVSLSSIASYKQSLVRSSQESMSDLNRVATKSCQEIMDRKSRIEGEIQASRDTQLARMTDLENKLQAYVTKLRQSQTFFVDLREYGTSMEAIESYNKFSTTVTETRHRFTTSTKFQLQTPFFISGSGVRFTNVHFGSFKTQILLFGNLGAVTSKYHNVDVDKKTLKVTSMPSNLFGPLSSRTVLKIGLFVTAFLVLKHVVRRLSKGGTGGEAVSPLVYGPTKWEPKHLEDLWLNLAHLFTNGLGRISPYL